jgi:tRNA pseudouridine(38-40) synthase
MIAIVITLGASPQREKSGNLFYRRTKVTNLVQPALDFQTWKLTLAYDGTDFSGWQVQPGEPTVQGELQQALGRVTGEFPLPQGSGRTDAGVHALGQVASLVLQARIPPDNLRLALNRTLPESIRILQAETVAATFHARHSAVAKTYEYRIFRGDICPPFLARYVLACAWPMDVEALQESAQPFVGEHNFLSFAATDPDLNSRTAQDIFPATLKPSAWPLLPAVRPSHASRPWPRSKAGSRGLCLAARKSWENHGLASAVGSNSRAALRRAGPLRMALRSLRRGWPQSGSHRRRRQRLRMPAGRQAARGQHRPRRRPLRAPRYRVSPPKLRCSPSSMAIALKLPAPATMAPAWSECWPSPTPLVQAKVELPAPLIFLGNVGEEGEGDLRGVRHLYTTGRARRPHRRPHRPRRRRRRLGRHPGPRQPPLSGYDHRPRRPQLYRRRHAQSHRRAGLGAGHAGRDPLPEEPRTTLNSAPSTAAPASTPSRKARRPPSTSAPPARPAAAS